MNINKTLSQGYSKQINSASSNPHKQVSFGATPEQILDSLETAGLCPGKKSFLRNVAVFFDGLQGKMHQIAEAPAEYVYRLGQENQVPDTLANTKVGNLTLRDLDNGLNANPFKCKPGATCGCGGGKTKGTFVKNLLEQLNVEEPDVITIRKNNS